jgi:ABC-type multidrug transport system ATPase subunit
MTTISRIEVRRVSRSYGAQWALRDVSVDFAPGPIHFVQGPNGAGKSTLLAVVGTVLRPSSGHVLFPPLGRDRVAVRAQLGWVGHESHCYAELTGRENVELAARLYGVDPASAWERTGARVGAERFGAQPVGTLSRGQRQRIALARALVHEPAVLLLDEPLTGLDTASAARFESILREERDRGAIVVVINHDPSMARRLNGREVFLRAGSLDRTVEPEELVEPAAR